MDQSSASHFSIFSHGFALLLAGWRCVLTSVQTRARRCVAWAPDERRPRCP